MSYSALENSPITIDLLVAANTTGWSVANDIASHDSCNAGSIILEDYPLTAGQTYRISWICLTISGGNVQARSPGSNGAVVTTPGLHVETLTPTANGLISFFSNANCTIKAFSIQDTFQATSNTQQNTLVYATEDKKWNGFRTIAPDFGFSIYIDMLTLYLGRLYLHQNGSASRNNFYGTQYQTILQYVENHMPQEIKSYNSVVLQSNQLMVTTESGITTSLGQVSELIDQDFLKSALNDGVSSVNVYSVLGTFSASFLRDINSEGGLINGDQLMGNYIIVTLVTINGNTPLKLFSIATNASKKNIGNR